MATPLSMGVFGCIGGEEAYEGSLEFLPAGGVAVRILAAAPFVRGKDYAGCSGLAGYGKLGIPKTGCGAFIHHGSEGARDCIGSGGGADAAVEL